MDVKTRSGFRDIDLVLVTGAGASHEFGTPVQKMPLMGDWAEHIVQKLSSTNLGYLDVTGLRKGMSGEEFEKGLGAFLRRRLGFAAIKDLIAPTRTLPGVSQWAQADDVLKGWYEQTAQHLDRIVELVNESLYEQFAAPARNLEGAAASYSGLFHMLGLNPGQSRLVYATTNYDDVGENALAQGGWLPDWGQPPPVSPGGTEEPLAVGTLLSGMPRYAPVLHLHGRVGWYRRSDESLYAANVMKHSPEHGTPVVVYPDPQKVYDGEPVIAALWAQFREALQRAKLVLVLGHSLNDSGLVRELADQIEPSERIGVGLLADGADLNRLDDSATSVLAIVQRSLGNASLIPIRFGSSPDAGAPGIKDWLDRAKSIGLTEDLTGVVNP